MVVRDGGEVAPDSADVILCWVEKPEYDTRTQVGVSDTNEPPSPYTLLLFFFDNPMLVMLMMVDVDCQLCRTGILVVGGLCPPQDLGTGCHTCQSVAVVWWMPTIPLYCVLWWTLSEESEASLLKSLILN